MSVILEALERAKREKARRQAQKKQRSLASNDPAHEHPFGGESPSTKSLGSLSAPNPRLAPYIVLALVLVALLGATIGMGTFILLDRTRPVTVTNSTLDASPVPPSVQISIPTVIPQDPLAFPEPAPGQLPFVADLPVTQAILPPGASDLPTAAVRQPEFMTPAVQAPLPPPEPILPKLGSIICGERGCIAMIDGRTTREGDRVAEFTITEINRDSVILQDSFGRNFILHQQR